VRSETKVLAILKCFINTRFQFLTTHRYILGPTPRGLVTFSDVSKVGNSSFSLSQFHTGYDVSDESSASVFMVTALVDVMCIFRNF